MLVFDMARCWAHHILNCGHSLRMRCEGFKLYPESNVVNMVEGGAIVRDEVVVKVPSLEVRGNGHLRNV
jgi:hypothetical protein